MHRTSIAMLLAGAVAATASVATAGAPQTRSLTFASPFDSGRSAEVNAGRKGFSPGDSYYTTGERLIDPETGERLGSSDGAAVVLGRARGGTLAFTGTMHVPGGTLGFNGILRHGDEAQTLPITGGTGDYEGARGSVTIRSDERRERNVWRVTLLAE